MIDCDLSYSPATSPPWSEALEESRAKMAVASPYMPGGETVRVPRHLERRSRMANAFLARGARRARSTLTGMVRAYDGPFIRAMALKSVDDEINIEALYKAMILRGRMVEVPATLDWSGLAACAGRHGPALRRAPAPRPTRRCSTGCCSGRTWSSVSRGLALLFGSALRSGSSGCSRSVRRSR